MSGVSFADGVVAVDPTDGSVALSGTTVTATTGFRAADGTAAAPSYSFSADPDTGLFTAGVANTMFVSLGTVPSFGFFNNTGLGYQLLSTLPLTWSSGGVNSASDLMLFRDAANTLAQRNGTNAQAFRVYNTYTDASNYERAALDWSTFGANTLALCTVHAGTGVSRSFLMGTTGTGLVGFVTNNTVRWNVNGTTGALEPGTNGAVGIGTASTGIKHLYIDYTNTATVGAVTIDKAAGRVNIAAAGTSVVVTNSLVTAASEVFAVISKNDATAVLKNVVPAAGSFTITLSAAATAEVSISFFVVNTD